jgi:hypothetical protein
MESRHPGEMARLASAGGPCLAGVMRRRLFCQFSHVNEGRDRRRVSATSPSQRGVSQFGRPCHLPAAAGIMYIRYMICALPPPNRRMPANTSLCGSPGEVRGWSFPLAGHILRNGFAALLRGELSRALGARELPDRSRTASSKKEQPGSSPGGPVPLGMDSPPCSTGRFRFPCGSRSSPTRDAPRRSRPWPSGGKVTRMTPGAWRLFHDPVDVSR